MGVRLGLASEARKAHEFLAVNDGAAETGGERLAVVVYLRVENSSCTTP